MHDGEEKKQETRGPQPVIGHGFGRLEDSKSREEEGGVAASEKLLRGWKQSGVWKRKGRGHRGPKVYSKYEGSLR